MIVTTTFALLARGTSSCNLTNCSSFGLNRRLLNIDELPNVHICIDGLKYHAQTEGRHVDLKYYRVRVEENGCFLNRNGDLVKENLLVDDQGNFLEENGFRLYKDGDYVNEDNLLVNPDGSPIVVDGYVVTKDGLLADPESHNPIQEDDYFRHMDGFRADENGFGIQTEALDFSGIVDNHDGMPTAFVNWNGLQVNESGIPYKMADEFIRVDGLAADINGNPMPGVYGEGFRTINGDTVDNDFYCVSWLTGDRTEFPDPVDGNLYFKKWSFETFRTGPHQRATLDGYLETEPYSGVFENENGQLVDYDGQLIADPLNFDATIEVNELEGLTATDFVDTPEMTDTPPMDLGITLIVSGLCFVALCAVGIVYCRCKKKKMKKLSFQKTVDDQIEQVWGLTAQQNLESFSEESDSIMYETKIRRRLAAPQRVHTDNVEAHEILISIVLFSATFFVFHNLQRRYKWLATSD